MAFQNLSSRLQETMRKLRGKGRLSEKDVDQALREIRLALLEADVNYKVVRDFIAHVKERATGQEVLGSLTPGQQVIRIVNEELTQLMGGTQAKLTLASQPPSVIMLVGLQGSGKTTTSGKLARLLKSQGHRPLLVACDVYRPAAIKQLQVLGEQLEIPVFSMGEQNPVDIAKAACSHARRFGNDVVLLDTAGRLHVDEELMDELVEIKSAVNPVEILLVVDAMTGQDAVNVAEAFNERLELGGVILTKLDGDARGGAALSVKAVTGKPIKFVGVSEKMDGLEPFHPDRMASRILGMGDLLTLIEKAAQAVDQEKAEKMAAKLKEAEFTLEDFLEQIGQMKEMGPIDQLMGMIPGLGAKQLRGLEVDDSHLKKIEAIINSMTPEERRRPEIIGGSRRKRIALGSGTKVQDVNRLLKQFAQTKQMLKQFASPKGRKKRGMFSLFQ
ncbi:MAG: signal recognition particle protein [Limnochordia bacterium]|jgi:signal recognition particle subunit SRP54|nr:signal recognition particle protein [Limnochordia bacterium]MDI9464854.1 signal recognition particle protein [Bacillota bacterium]NLO96103.1 signal recognition particle protein [Bacillota bacterium]HAN94236.1 signal recognition particle protein [Bacillota bacterium]HOB39760.1 signal recognition particle protein [Limnochordia bacterium]